MKNLSFENLLSIDICASPKNDILHTVKSRLKSDKQTIIFTPNPQILLHAQKSKRYKNALNTATINLPDGIGVVLASKLRRGKIKKRIGGIDFAKSLLSIAEEEGYKIFLLGAKPKIANKAKQKLLEDCPLLNVCGTHHGYFKKSGKENGKKVPKITEEQYEEYIMSLKDETPVLGAKKGVEGHSQPHLQSNERK